ncbi:MAG: DUF362 domain-containing protein [Planctomycetota bacterium]
MGSLFYGRENAGRYYGADFDREKTIQLHSGETQAYVLSKTALEADVVISIPKWKTHKKVGVTLNVKGLVGITADKRCLVHYALGTPAEGGDQFPEGVLSRKEARKVRMQRWAFDHFLARKTRLGDWLYGRALALNRWILKPLGYTLDREKAVLDGGNWHGNDSAWRMAQDLLNVFLYADPQGELHSAPQRRFFSVIDGILAGEGEGPLLPDAKACGLLMAGFNPVAVDHVATRLMGLDFQKIPLFRTTPLSAMKDLRERMPGAIRVASNTEAYRNPFASEGERFLAFTPPPGWADHVEIG